MGVLVYHRALLRPSALCHFRRKEMKSQDGKYVGIDCGKKTLEVVRINSENSFERRQFSTTESGINSLLKCLTLNDIVGLGFSATLKANTNASLAFSNLALHGSLDWLSIF
ncbi:hypothetical protein LEP1GSC062_2210 [Leptospira alexanderi serovar Manhao 3 str. L 60]|uniref:Transposase domain protein n=1 Tax=Leptospira alexanderi serovar Manhao 3 str. L 60 TaxID=1049759 RepID=V6HSI6_9LEPT|nr:hypothetical protein LEP1GSC062_0203 [Leptospira alexanderi serovar Manhao 3 str. L 60]EQA64765.1 hypothetical protein LEP1GSC062_2210 [Leptospira alexanderi serovar Manhao 3 str. L 60]